MTNNPNTGSLDHFLASHRQRLEYFLDNCLNPGAGGQGDSTLVEAMRYSTLDGGKRIRAMLVYLAADACAGHTDDALLDPAAAALEMIHAYSLVHDDLPAMDDDELRRGKPANHIAFGEAMAILAGDALQSSAFEILATAKTDDSSKQLSLVRELATAAGSQGMVGGQAIDIAAVNHSLDEGELENMHRLKTGALMCAAVKMGAICGDATATQLTALQNYGHAIGLAFQVQDDILDVEGETAAIGKARGADSAANKPTYPALLGLGGAKARARALVEQAIAALSVFDQRAEHLRALATYIIERQR